MRETARKWKKGDKIIDFVEFDIGILGTEDFGSMEMELKVVFWTSDITNTLCMFGSTFGVIKIDSRGVELILTCLVDLE